MGNQPQFAAHRLTVGRVVAVLVCAASLGGVVDVLAHGQLRSAAPGLCVLLAGPLLAYVLGIRPAVLESPTGVEVRNPLRTTVIGWAALTDADVTDVLRLRAGDTWVRCFAVPRRRPPMTAVRSAATTGFMLPPRDPGPGWEAPVGEPRARALAQRLRDQADVHSGRAAAWPQPWAYAAEQRDHGPHLQRTSGGDSAAGATRWAPDALAAVAGAALLLVIAVILR